MKHKEGANPTPAAKMMKMKLGEWLKDPDFGKNKGPSLVGSLIHDLEVYQAELEMQNQELRASREALEKSHDRYVSLYDFAPQGYVTFDPNGTIREVNLTAVDLLGRVRTRLIGYPFSHCISLRDRPAFRNHLRQCLIADPRSQVKTELAILGRNNEEVPVQILSVAAMEENLMCFRTMVVELTDQKRQERMLSESIQREKEARAEAEQANRAKDEFMAMISHELRAPLQPVLGWLELIRSGEVSPDQMGNVLEIIERNARAQGQIINDLLDISRATSGKLTVELSPMAIEPILNNVIESVKLMALEKEIKINYKVNLEAGRINGDLNRIRQIIWNLLSNAIKFTPAGGEVTVSNRRAGDKIEIIVSDTGKGIPSELLPHIFERFFQEDIGVARNKGGLGLGLAITDHLVRQHRGTIHAESGGVGKGAAFIVSFPRLSDSDHFFRPSHIRDSGAAQLPNLRGLTVLVVDDDTDTREILAAILRAQAIGRVYEVASASEALKLIAWKRFDIVISDIAMPGEDGYSLARKIRKSFPDHTMPLLALSACAGAEPERHANQAGFDAYLVKPVNPRQFITTIDRLARGTDSKRKS